jgi:hypothetical protein
MKKHQFRKNEFGITFNEFSKNLNYQLEQAYKKLKLNGQAFNNSKNSNTQEGHQYCFIEKSNSRL